MRGVGVHVFAGGFTRGVRRVMPVVGQLEVHNFGRETVEAMGLPFMNADSWKGWWDYRSTWKDCSFCYGNPRCTAFSGYSSRCDAETRGPRAKPCQDIWDLCNFGVEAELDVVAFESVQQAYSVGRQLLNVVRDALFVPNGYRIAHLFVNTAAEGNVQCRRRYFFVAYKKDRNFNVCLPELPRYRTVVRDVLAHPIFKKMKPNAGRVYGKKSTDYDFGTHAQFTPDEKAVLPLLQQGEGLNSMARRDAEPMRDLVPKLYRRWVTRESAIPFSLHCPTRLHDRKHCPTIASTSARLVHPRENRPCTVGEIAAFMGWGYGVLPSGPDPISQIGKGVVPATGEWLAEQIKRYLDDRWGPQDFESSYHKPSDEFRGNDWTYADEKPVEKIFNLTHYLPPFKEGDGR